MLPFQNIFDCLLYRASEAREKNFTILKLSSIFILKSWDAVGPNVLREKMDCIVSM